MPKDPTGQEHETPVKITDTSATERASFRGCRRKWFLSVVHRLQSVEVNPNFWLGNLIHSGLEAYYRHLMEVGVSERTPGSARLTHHYEAVELALDHFQSEYDAAIKDLRKQLGFLWATFSAEYTDAGSLGFEMLQNYFEREIEHPLFDKVVDVERRVYVPIRDPNGKIVARLSVRTDAVGRRRGVLAVADHKSLGRDAVTAQLELDDQLTAEVYAVWKERGEFPEEAIYNVLIKKVAEPPKRNQDKRGVPQLSKAQKQNTTYELYRAEIARLGLDPAEYAEILEHYRERDESGDSPYFQREGVMRSENQMASFEANLYEEWRDMMAVAAHPERAYPNPTTFQCPSCPVKLVCLTMQDGGDVRAIIQASYVVGDPRR